MQNQQIQHTELYGKGETGVMGATVTDDSAGAISLINKDWLHISFI